MLIPFLLIGRDFLWRDGGFTNLPANILNLVSAFNPELIQSLLDFDHCFAIDQLSIRDFPSSTDQSDEAGNQRNYEWKF